LSVLRNNDDGVVDVCLRVGVGGGKAGGREGSSGWDLVCVREWGGRPRGDPGGFLLVIKKDKMTPLLSQVLRGWYKWWCVAVWKGKETQ